MLHHIISIVYVIPSPVPLETLWNTLSELPAHEAQYSNDQLPGAAPHFSQHAGSVVYASDPSPAMDPLLNHYGGPQAPGPTAVQSQLHPNLHNMSVPELEAPGHVPMNWFEHPHNDGVEGQQSTPHGYTEKVDSRDDVAIADTNVRPMSPGSSSEMNDNEPEWTLNLDGTCAQVRALMTAAIGDPYVLAFVKCVLVGDLHACRKLLALLKELKV